jgi:hypothetical protein
MVTMAAVTVDMRATGTRITGDKIRAIADILGLDHVEFTDIQRIDITPADVTVTLLHHDQDGPVTVAMTMPIHWS